MEIQKALDQIAEINRHLAKTEICRAFRSVPVGMTGIVAIAGGMLMPAVITAPTPASFVTYWVTLAILNVALVSAQVSAEYLGAGSRERNLVWRVIGQLFPALAAGAVITLVFVWAARDLVSYLPGLWMLIFSLGLFSARPYLPRTLGWVALFYGAAGTILLMKTPENLTSANLYMGAVFGGGQLLSSLVFYWNLERGNDG
ncbi:MAG: hypothetical protein QGF00_31100 [Planctomycetota bacterium]|jgi:hypothetical protein|nr:hypothetical protein [Planctomycetota bacterium]MDP7254090.1 hypothetical protein [Planctomycetota bacterium]